MKVTEVPAHTGFADGAIDTLTGSTGFTVMVMAFEVAGLPVAHVAFEVSTHVITSPFKGTYEYVARLDPTGDAPLYH